jgi:2-methylisocitrate lyase-like PEP mutase family enzyme
MTAADLATELRRRHDAPEPLILVNVWDVASARVVAGLPGCTALATASHSIAAAHGYDDGEQIPLDLMIDAIARIAAAVQLPVSADLEAGYGDVETTVRRAIGAGAVGGNIEDAMRPLGEAVAAVEAAVRAGEAEGVPFVLNARTDVFLAAGERGPDEVIAEAVRRGRAFLDAGAACVFMLARLDVETAARLVEGIGIRKVSVIALPGGPTPAQFGEVGVARVSFGPGTLRVALTALADVGADLLAGAALPANVRSLV